MSKTKKLVTISLVLVFSFIFQALPTYAQVMTYKGYRAELVDTSYSGTIRAQAGKDMTLEVSFKNTGTKTWHNDDSKFVTLDVSEPYLRESPFWHKWWRTWDCPAWLLESEVAPGEIGTFIFAIHIPTTPGEYTENFRLAATDEAWIPGGGLTIRFSAINSTYSGVAEKSKEVVTTPATEVEDVEVIEEVADPRFDPTRYKVKSLDDFTKMSLPLPLNEVNPDNGPNVRIGLYSTEEAVVISSTETYKVYDAKDKLLVTKFNGGELKAKFDFKTKFLKLYGGNDKLLITTNGALRFVSNDENIPLEIPTNKTNTNSWQQYTLFKGVLELRYTDDDTFWIINELPVEDYLKGSAECGNNNPSAYLEAMAIAERSYALQRLLNNGKHAVRNFDLVSHTGDQVYRGYSRELTQPNVVKAVNDTNGVVITYNNDVVITPYFAHSNGWTLSWPDAWGGTDKPWLQPVYVPVDDDGNGRFGHGVGMSAIGAKDMAKNDYNFEEILNWFHTDIELLRY